MKTGIRNYGEITKELKVNYPKLTEYEILTLAIQIERNEILENGLVVSTNNNTPSGIEAIASALGNTDSEPRNTIANILTEIANKG